MGVLNILKVLTNSYYNMDKPNKYHNSCIYKIWKDNLIYIGSTFNFKQRVIQHKSRCTNEKSKSHNLKIYKTIRMNGR